MNSTLPRLLRVAAAQIETVPGDIDANLAKHLAVIDDARTAGVELLVFPELSLTGYTVAGDALGLARDREDPLVERIAKAAGPMCVVFGLIEEGPAAQFFNTAIAVKDGKLLYLHRKLNLPTYGQLEEGKHFATGRYLDTFLLQKPWRAGLLICADLWNPALVHLAALHGATLLLAPISSAVEAVGAEFDNPRGWNVNLQFYAMMYGMPVLMANRVGMEGNLHFWGGSRILDPFGDPLASSQKAEETLLVANLDYDALRQARFRLPTVRDANLSLILRETERLAQVIGVPDSVRSQ